MAQCREAGMTDYSGQSDTQILDDIKLWITYSNVTKEKITSQINQLNENIYYKDTVPEYVKECLQSSLISIDKNVRNLSIVKNAIENNIITNKIIILLYNDGIDCREQLRNLKIEFKGADHYPWQDYTDRNFHKVEKVYVTISNYYATLLDMTNAAVRLKDYMEDDNRKTENIPNINVDNSIKIGNGNKINKSVIGRTAKVEQSEKESIKSKLFWWIMGIVGGVIVVGISIWLKLN